VSCEGELRREKNLDFRNYITWKDLDQRGHRAREKKIGLREITIVGGHLKHGGQGGETMFPHEVGKSRETFPQDTKSEHTSHRTMGEKENRLGKRATRGEGYI